MLRTKLAVAFIAAFAAMLMVGCGGTGTGDDTFLSPLTAARAITGTDD